MWVAQGQHIFMYVCIIYICIMCILSADFFVESIRLLILVYMGMCIYIYINTCTYMVHICVSLPKHLHICGFVFILHVCIVAKWDLQQQNQPAVQSD